jgi:hypothetical protein
MRLSLFHRLMSLSIWLLAVLAQSGTNTSESDLAGCPGPSLNTNAPVNATGSVKLHWDALMMDPAQNDWIFTLTYNESRNRQDPYVRFETLHFFQAYISVPKVNEARSCVYMFGSLNKTSKSTARNGCDGVLHDSCTNILRNITFSGSRCQLPSSWSLETRDIVKEACGDEFLAEGTLYNSKSQTRKAFPSDIVVYHC